MRSILTSWSTFLIKLGYRRQPSRGCRTMQYRRKLRYEQFEGTQKGDILLFSINQNVPFSSPLFFP